MGPREIRCGAATAEVAGPEGAPGVVLIHGTRMAAAYWHADLRALGRHYRAVAVDLPGHGRRRGEPFTHEGAMGAIRAGIELCAGAAAVVVGHSLGGFMAMDFAERSPERCLGLVLVGCSMAATGPRTWPYRLVGALLPLLPEARLTRWNDSLLRRSYPAELVEPQIAAGYGFAAVRASWGAVLGRDHARALARYPGPVLFVNGERDWFRAGERRFTDACPRAGLSVIPGASHLCNWDQPAAFTRVVEKFLARVYTEGAIGGDPGPPEPPPPE